MSHDLVTRRLQQLTQHLTAASPQPLSVGDALKAKTPGEAAATTSTDPSSFNNLDTHKRQAHVSLSTVLIPDAVAALNNKHKVTLDEWKASKGKVVGTGEWWKVTQDRVDAFAVTTGDPQWIHTSGAAKLGSPFGSPIAHGFLTVSMLPYLCAKVVPAVEGSKMGVNYGIDKLRFISPVPVGKRIRVIVKLLDTKEVQSGGAGKGIENRLGVTVEVEGSKKPALSAEWLGRAYF